VSHWLTREFLDFLARKNTPSGQIRVLTDQHGITLVESGGASLAIRWEQITQVVAFKRDVYAHDLLCILIEQAGAGVSEVNESMPGWERMIEQLPIYLPDASRWHDWYPKAAFPAFDPAPTLIFAREKTAPPD
jgi:hypothetical protein